MPTIRGRVRRPGPRQNAPAAGRKRRHGTGKAFVPPLTISRPEFITGGIDADFRNVIYAMVLGLQRLMACREAFGSHLGLTGSQFAVLIGTAYRQGRDGVTIKDLSDHVLLAATHVTTEVGRLMRKGLLVKRPNSQDRRSVLVCLTARGEAAVRAVTPVVRDVNDILFAGIGARELQAAGRVLKMVALNSDAALEHTRAPRRGERPRRRSVQRAGGAAGSAQS